MDRRCCNRISSASDFEWSCVTVIAEHQVDIVEAFRKQRRFRGRTFRKKGWRRSHVVEPEQRTRDMQWLFSGTNTHLKPLCDRVICVQGRNIRYSSDGYMLEIALVMHIPPWTFNVSSQASTAGIHNLYII